MTSRLLRPIAKVGLFMIHLATSATGCFMFDRGFRLFAMNEHESHSRPHMHHIDEPPQSLAEIGAALLLLAFVSSEALVTFLALTVTVV